MLTRSLALVMLGAGLGVTAQELQPPPDFSHIELTDASETVVKAWKAWQGRVLSTERDSLALPMIEARIQVEKTYGLMLAFFDARRAYSEKVALQLERPQVARTKSSLNSDLINGDEIDLLGANLASLQESLAVLRNSPDWTKVRRSLQSDRDTVAKLQESRRDDISITRPLAKSDNNQPVTPRIYRNSEKEVVDALQHLWTSYYQALANSLSRNPSDVKPLTATPPSATASSVSAATGDLNSKGVEKSQLLGAWTYVEGSQQFNGVGEPHQVVLELWIENGQMAGRYRAELPDFDGPKRVDLALRGKISSGHEQVLDFHSVEPGTSGKILLQKQGTGGLEVMLVRMPDSHGAVPRGREVLSRR